MIDTYPHMGGVDGTDDIQTHCAHCNQPFPYLGAFTPSAVPVNGAWVHDYCTENYWEKQAQSHLTKAQKKALRENKAPWVLGKAIHEFRFSRWFEWRLAIWQWVTNKLKGLA